MYDTQGHANHSITVDDGCLSSAAFPHTSFSPPSHPSPSSSFYFVNSTGIRITGSEWAADFTLLEWSLDTGAQVSEGVSGSIPTTGDSHFCVVSLVQAWDGTFIMCGNRALDDNPCCFFDAQTATVDCHYGYSGRDSTLTLDGRGRLALLDADFRRVTVYDTNSSTAHQHNSTSSSSASQRRLPSSSTAAADTFPCAPPSSLSSSTAGGCACPTTPFCESGWSTAAVVAIALSCLCAGVLLGVVLLRVLQVCHERREDKRAQHSPASDGVRSPMLGHMQR